MACLGYNRLKLSELVDSTKLRPTVKICLIILLALTLRLTGINFDSLWLDEAYQSLVGASGHGKVDFSLDKPKKFLFRFQEPAPASEMLANFRSVDPLCPPLYALILNGWISLFAGSDFALRSLSALASTATVSVLLIFAGFLFGWQTAILAGLLAAVSPYEIHYGQEARMYSFVELAAAVSCLSLIAIIKSELRSRISFLLLPLYAVSTWALVSFHYTALFLAASQVFASVTFLSYTKKWRTLVCLFFSWVICGILCLPWLGMFLQSASARKASFYVARADDFFWPFKTLLLRLEINWLSFLSGQRVIAYAAGLYASSFVMLASAAVFFRRDRNLGFSIACLWIWAILPALGIWLIDVLEKHKVVEVSRYLIFTSPAVFLLAGYGLSRLGKFKKGKVLSIVLTFHLLFAGINLIYTHTVKQREPWREMARQVENLVQPDEVLVVSQYYNIACLDRYLQLPRMQMGLSPAMGKEALAASLGKLPSFALLTAQDGEAIVPLLPDIFKLEKQVDLSHGLHLRIFRKSSR